MDSRKSHLTELFEFLDGKCIGKKYQEALAANDEAAAVAAAAEYFRSRPVSSYLNNLHEQEYSAEIAENAVQGDVIFSAVRWKFPGGRIDWTYDPSGEVSGTTNYEWTWQLNRMTFWIDMALAYLHTGKERIAEAFAVQLRDFVLLTECPLSYDGPNPDNWKPWNCPRSAWRGIETGLRMRYAWQVAFEVFRKSKSLSDENLCLMAASMHRQALHLQTRHNETTNRLLMEMSGLSVFSCLFDEFRDAAELRNYAFDVFAKAVDEQILPDGMHYELSPGYFVGIMTYTADLVRAAKCTGKFAELPKKLLDAFERMSKAIVPQLTPGLGMPVHNDAEDNSFINRAVIAAEMAFEFFPENRELLWVKSRRKQGTPPGDVPTPSTYMPYNGAIMMRTGWDENALFCRFDVGPRGCGHRHWDKLNVNIIKGNVQLVFDDGGGEYENSIFIRYGRSSADHNLVMIDGMVQQRMQPQRYFEPGDAVFVTNEKYDYASCVYDQEFALLDLERREMPVCYPAVHRREVKMIKPEFFCVVDTLTSSDNKAHEYQLRWHLDTLNVKPSAVYPGAMFADLGKEYDLLIVPVGSEMPEKKILCGTMPPEIGGWFLSRGKRRKANTLCMTLNGKDCRFATLLIPVARGGALPEIKKLDDDRFEVIINGSGYIVDINNLNQ